MPGMIRTIPTKSTVPQTPDPDLGSRILKVNHAGENRAVNIYRGQILSAGLTARSMVAELREFKAHEERHRAIFAAELQRRGHRPRRQSGAQYLPPIDIHRAVFSGMVDLENAAAEVGVW